MSGLYVSQAKHAINHGLLKDYLPRRQNDPPRCQRVRLAVDHEAVEVEKNRSDFTPFNHYELLAVVLNEREDVARRESFAARQEGQLNNKGSRNDFPTQLPC